MPDVRKNMANILISYHFIDQLQFIQKQIATNSSLLNSNELRDKNIWISKEPPFNNIYQCTLHFCANLKNIAG